MPNENAIDGTANPHEDCPTMEIPDENPFRDQIIDLASDGHSWAEIHEMLEEAYNPIDKAALEESKEYIPVWEIRAVVYDENATSQERYETYEVTMETKEEAERWAIEHKMANRVENIEQIDEAGVYT